MKIENLLSLMPGALSKRVLVELKNIGSSVKKPEGTPIFNLEEFFPHFIADRITDEAGTVVLHCASNFYPLLHADDALYEIIAIEFKFAQAYDPNGWIFVVARLNWDMGDRDYENDEWYMVNEKRTPGGLFEGTFSVAITKDDITLTEL